MRENEVFLDAMAQSVATDVIYGAQAAGNNGLIGFAERYSTLTRKIPTATCRKQPIILSTQEVRATI